MDCHVKVLFGCVAWQDFLQNVKPSLAESFYLSVSFFLINSYQKLVAKHEVSNGY